MYFIGNFFYIRYENKEHNHPGSLCNIAHITNAMFVDGGLSNNVACSDYDQESTNNICSAENNGMI